MPPAEIVASLPKVVVPVPLSEARVIPPVTPLKVAEPALVTPASERLVPEIVAEAPVATPRVAELL